MKDQLVIACVENATDAAWVMPWVRHFAERLNHKGMMALHVSRQKEDDSWLKELGVPYVGMQGEWSTAIEGLPTVFNGILAVVAVDPKAPHASLNHPKTLLREFKNCKIAYLCVNVSTGHHINVSTSALTMTHRREGKELLVWASYLARFLDSEITIAHPDYRDQGLRGRWLNNMRFVNKIFNPLQISYKSVPIGGATDVDRRTLDELQPDLLIARTTDTRDRDLLDLLAPLPEYRLLTHPSHTPLLLLNPRDDLYILCD